jgi:glycosyltransferase involved in cell wall biosynthesis
VPGRFHAFNLVMQLQNGKISTELYTSYPAFKVREYGIHAASVHSILSKELLYRFHQKIYGYNHDSLFINNWFDWMVSMRVNPDRDLFVIWSGFGLKTMRRIRKSNPKAVLIIERGSTHIGFQQEILRHAYRRFPELRPALPSHGIIDKELKEYEEADYISVPTDFVKKTFVDKKIPEDKLLVTPYGVDLSSFTPGKSSRETSKIEILFTGHFCVRKGAGTFLDIMDLLKEDSGFHFTIVGNLESGLKERLRPFIEKGILNYRDHVPQAQLNEIYQSADIFLFPSYEEGMAMVLLQAMACGLAVIASPNSGAAMAIKHGENGYLAEPESREDILQILLGLRADKNLLNLIGHRARQSVESGFGWEDYGNKIINKYRDLIHE